MYKVPEEYYQRLHHVRPRFKSNVENVLLFMANTASVIKLQPTETYDREFANYIRAFPGNSIREQKTIENWRTEISALFGFKQTDGKLSFTGKRALELSKNQDLVQFFKIFCFNFQYPGGHIKPHENAKLIEKGIRFKPVQYILKMLFEINLLTEKSNYITKEEACHCVFNDLRCTRDHEAPEIVWDRIQANRENNVIYDSTGDVIRYAGDILDYMEIANLLKCYDGHSFYLNEVENETIIRFIKSTEYFTEYDEMIADRKPVKQELAAIGVKWFDWVNRDLDESDFSTDIVSYISGTFTPTEIREVELLFKKMNDDEINTKDIGDCGEALVFGHECQFLKNNGRSDLIHLVKHIPTSYAVGYDIQSVESNNLKKYIEVKTTVSHASIDFYNMHLTPNEWNTAHTNREHYFIYRLMVTKTECKLFIMCDPFDLYCKGYISMIPRNGAEITVLDSKNAGKYVELLRWAES